MSFEVAEPILNSPYEEPAEHWVIHEGLEPERRQGRRLPVYYLDTDKRVEAFVKNAGMGFAIPYFHNGQPHEYVPDFIVRLVGQPPVHLVLETKGYDPLADVKIQAAKRWVDAVNADGRHGIWRYEIVRQVTEIPKVLGSKIGDR